MSATGLVGILVVANIASDFVEEGGDVVAVEKPGSDEMILFEPAQPFAMGAIGEDADGVAADGPFDETSGEIEEVVGAGEFASLRRRTGDELASEFDNFWGFVVVRCSGSGQRPWTWM